MSKNLKDVEWKVFPIYKLFKIQKVYGKPINNYKMGTIPYVSTTSLNNGIIGFVIPNKEAVSNKKAISVDPIKGNAFYHPYNFVGRGFSGASINLLYNEHLNKYNAIFICKLIEYSAKDKASYGYLYNSDRLEKSKILLPINSDGKPDYEFMEEYIKERETKLKKQYKDYIQNRVAKLQKKVQIPKEWKEFLISEIFDIKSGKRLTKADMVSGKIPFIGATDSNNGITNFVSNTNSSTDKNVLGVNYNGSVVENFYHPYKCTFSDDVKRFTTKNIQGNKYIYLFLKNAILKQKEKYMYGYKFNENRMKRQKIILPITSDGKPDYEYMEDYMKYLEQQKLLEYLDYIK